jgi:hypothetical protein
MISCDNKLTPQVSVTAYGTAIKYERKQQWFWKSSKTYKW